MNDDGSMARLPELVAFAQHHNLKLGSIADLIAHRRRTERLIERVTETPFTDNDGNQWRMIVYATTIEYSEHIVLVKGDLSGDEPVLVRMHQVDIIDNLMLGPRWQVSHGAMRMIAKAGRGVVVILRESQPTLVSDRVKRLEAHMPPPTDIRDNGVGAQILTDLGVKKMIMLSNTRQHVVGLEGYGIEVVDRRVVDARPSAFGTAAA